MVELEGLEGLEVVEVRVGVELRVLEEDWVEVELRVVGAVLRHETRVPVPPLGCARSCAPLLLLLLLAAGAQGFSAFCQNAEAP